MTLELFEHNKRALDEVFGRWESGAKRCCVIHAVGTGKSFIYHKLAEIEKSARILVLSPTNYIFDVQRMSVKKVCPDYDFDAYSTRTYYSNYKIAKQSPDLLGKWDYIVLDEFHRAGAKTWSVGVEELFVANPDARVLGLSATPIRYSDSGRNMAEEIFGNNIASCIMLPDAWAQDILKKPRYIIGDYQTGKTIQSAEKMLATCRYENRKEEMQRVLDQMRRAVVSSTMNLSNIFASGLDSKAAKLIIFCRSVTDLKIARSKCGEWFEGVNTNIHKYKVLVSNYKNDEEAEGEWYDGRNVLELRAFNDDNDPEALKILFCIDALNEGVHVDSVDGVVLMRHTKSPIIYQQQIGRAMSTSEKKVPVVFDIAGVLDNVDLIYSIRDDYRKAHGAIAGGYFDKTDDFIIDDRIIEFAELNARMNELYRNPLTMDEMIGAVIADMQRKAS